MNPLRKLWYIADAAKRLLIDMGLAKSIWKQESRINGLSVPWLTLPAIHFLESRRWDSWTIIEFGSGSSTNYWGRRYENGEIARYYGIERDESFFKRMCAEDNPFYQMNVKCVPDKWEYINHAVQLLKSAHTPLLIVVDGQMGDKMDELRTALSLVREWPTAPILIVDDLNWLGKEARDELLVNDYRVIPFAGFFPGTSFSKVTAVCLHTSTYLPCLEATPVAGSLPSYKK